MNIGILGGTFDPIHIGHLIVAEEPTSHSGITYVPFVPAGQPWLRLDHNITPAIHRVEIVRRAIATNLYFKLCTLEVERPGPSYTVDTMITLREQLGTQASLFFVLGRDALVDLPLWKEPNRLIQICRLVAVPRLGSGLPNLKSLETSIPGITDNVIQLDMPVIGISSSQIRERLAQGLSIRYLVSDEVGRYIIEQRIYSKSIN